MSISHAEINTGQVATAVVMRTDAPAPAGSFADSVLDLASEPFARMDGDYIDGLPVSLVSHYAAVAVRHALAREVDGQWIASVVGLDGAWGEGSSSEAAIEDLRSVVVDWVAIRREMGFQIPPLEGVDLNDRR